MAESRPKRAPILALAAALSLLVVPMPVLAANGTCATPGRDGIATLSGVVNTYFPGSATAAAGSTSLTLGAATGSAIPIAIGDLVLVIQMQDAAIDSANAGAYGDGTAGDPATGSTALNASGLYEYAVATSAVPLVGGTLTISGPGLANTYTSAAPTASQGARDFQVVRVPQYASATLTSAVTAAAWNGSTGGILAVDVAAALALNGATVSVSQEGFRAGLGRPLAGGAGGTGTDYVNTSANPFHGQKGEGIAGTPHYLYDSRTGATVNNGSDGYPNGSTARGAPATAGGGGTDPNPTANDQNTGGGGGANGGAGGIGGNSWNSNLPTGGFGGSAFGAGATRLALGAGGGAGSHNNGGAANSSSGGNGGGIVMIRSGSVSGTATILADGGTGVAPLNDGGGGGGAGGSVIVAVRSGSLGGLTVNARGGAGTDAWATAGSGTPAGANYHGPGGGGGGGVVLTTSAPAGANVGGGVNGTTTTDLAPYGATPGAAGTKATITGAQVPGAGSGADCAPDLTILKTHTDPFARGGSGSYALTVTNAGGVSTSGVVTVTDSVPAGLTPTNASGTGWTCGIAAQTVTCTRSDALAAGTSYPPIAITVNILQSAAGSISNSAAVAGGGESDPTNDTATDATTIVSRADIAVTKTASPTTVNVGSNLTYTVRATNAGPSDATGVQLSDLLPAGLTFVSAAASSGSYDSATGVWTIGSIASGASATLTLTARVTATGVVTNTASKSAETENDPNLPNDTASVSITGRPTPALPGPPASGMANVATPYSTPLLGFALFGSGLLLLTCLAMRRRSATTALQAAVLALGCLLTLASPAPVAIVADRSLGYHAAPATPLDVQLFGKAVSTDKLVLGTGLPALHPASGAIIPTRIRIPALDLDTMVEGVGVTRAGAMDVPNNIWEAAWLRSGARPGAKGQAVIDGHLDSVVGSALFKDLNKLTAGDKIYVSDARGAELTFRVTALQVAPLNGFPTMRVFGPSTGRSLNLITCAGRYDTMHHTYDHRLVVFAVIA